MLGENIVGKGDDEQVKACESVLPVPEEKLRDLVLEKEPWPLAEGAEIASSTASKSERSRRALGEQETRCCWGGLLWQSRNCH